MEENQNVERKQGYFSRLKQQIKESISTLGSQGASARIGAVLAIVGGFFFGGCHIVFGVYPLGIALLAVLGGRVWQALIGVIIGSLTLGRAGVIYALISTLCVFLRVVITGGEKNRGLFTENGALRASVAAIGGFVVAIYEILLSGFSAASVLFAIFSVILPPLFTLLLLGFFDSGYSARGILFGSGMPEAVSDKSFKGTVFRISALIFIFLLSVSMKKYSLFGVDLPFIFASAIALFAAKRFGALYGGVCGFAASVGVSGAYSVAFALAGISAGALFSFGAPYALLGAGALAVAWGAYSAGVSGLLSILPEYGIGCIFITPMLRHMGRESMDRQEDSRAQAIDMVGTMALAYRNRQSLLTGEVGQSLAAAQGIVSRYLGEGGAVEPEIFGQLSSLIDDRVRSAEQMRRIDDELTGKLEELLANIGLGAAVGRVFGAERKYFIIAAEDKDGTLITSRELRCGIEELSGMRTSTPVYYRRGKMALMECSCAPKLSVEISVATLPGNGGEISGDSYTSFQNEQGDSYAIISDGMGSGIEAKRASELVCSFLSGIIGSGGSECSAVRMLNGIIRAGKEECSATLDLFKLDTVSGEGLFLKSGAAASYIRRGSSLFRIKSETMPLGVLKGIDTERIKANIFPGDVVIMLSDGICQSAEDSPWLVELLNSDLPKEDSPLKTFAHKIISAAIKNGGGRDDMTVLIISIKPSL